MQQVGKNPCYWKGYHTPIGVRKGILEWQEVIPATTLFMPNSSCRLSHFPSLLPSSHATCGARNYSWHNRVYGVSSLHPYAIFSKADLLLRNPFIGRCEGVNWYNLLYFSCCKRTYSTYTILDFLRNLNAEIIIG